MATDMTKGPIIPQLIHFTIPLILGNLLQLTYNATDSMIVGKYVGEHALAAVGTAGPIMNLFILFISGMCMGSGILMSTQYGAQAYDLLKCQISTTLWGGLLFSFSLTIMMTLFAFPILTLIRVPEQIIGEATLYLRIIFIGLIFTFIYNFFSNTLRALGDSKTSLYFLMISSIFNIVGDLFFVVVLHWGVIGSALATVLSQILSCISCVIYIIKKVPLLHLGKKWLLFDKTLLFKTFSYGITSALQLMCVQLGKVFVQVIVNTQGIAFMSAFTAVNRIDDFALTPQQNISHAATTFMAQNKGAGHIDRLKRGFFSAVLLNLIYSLIICIIVFLFSKPIMQLFIGESDSPSVSFGISYMKLISFMYFLSGITHMIQGFFRGIGHLKVTLISTISNMTVRVIFAFLFIKVFHFGFNSLAFSNLFGWIAMIFLELPMLIRCIKQWE